MKKVFLNLKKNNSKTIIVALLIFAFLFGWIMGRQDARFTGFGFLPKLINTQNNQDVDFATFWRAWDLLVREYDGELNFQSMVTGAIEGMVKAVGDPYTDFLTADEAKKLTDELSGTLSGIGAEVGIKNNLLTIIAPLDSSPAEKAGLKSGDVITSINGESTDAMNLDTAVSLIRGEAGTKVLLNIKRKRDELKFEVIREKVTVKSVKYEIRNKDTAYIVIRRFDENTTDELKTILDNLNQKNISKIILDLRDNPGGYLDQSVSVSSEFIKKGVIVTEKSDKKNSKPVQYNATGTGKMLGENIRIIVLINGGTASASEIVAGALKDYARARLVGEKTFGKGSVQGLEDLPLGAKIKITIAHWYTPHGKNISKEGITPDIEVKMNDSDYNNNRDPQLDKALELLR